MQRITVEVSNEVFEAMEAYSRVANQSVNMQVREALEDYAECTISARLEDLSYSDQPARKNNVVTIQ